MQIKRGDIWFAMLNTIEESVQRGIRPVVIISNNRANFYGPIVTVAPISTKSNGQSTHVEIEVDTKSFVICEQILTINKKSLRHFKRACTKDELERIDRALNIQLGKPQVDEAFNIDKVKNLIISITSLDKFLYEYKNVIIDTKEIIKSIEMQIEELESYCSKFNVDYTTFYGELNYCNQNNQFRRVSND